MKTTTKGNRMEATNIPNTLYRRATKAAKANNQTKEQFVKAAIDLYCDVQEGKATIRRKAK